MKSLLKLIILSSTLVLTGCVTVTQLSEMPFSDWKKVALLVKVDETVYGSKVGTTVFNNESANWTETGIQLKQLLERELTESFEENTQWEVSTKVRAFETHEEEIIHDDHKLLVYGPSSQLMEDVLNEGFDGLVFFTTSASRDDLAGTNQGYRAFGIYHRSTPFFKNSWYVSVGRLQFYDLDDPENFWSSFHLKYTEEISEDFEWKAEWNEYSPEEQEKIASELERVITSDFLGQLNQFYLESGLTIPTPTISN